MYVQALDLTTVSSSGNRESVRAAWSVPVVMAIHVGSTRSLVDMGSSVRRLIRRPLNRCSTAKDDAGDHRKSVSS